MICVPLGPMRDIVLLPGFMCDNDLWRDMVPELSTLGQLHYGNVFHDDTLEGMAQRVLAEAPARFVLVGFSMGGFVARVLALMAPQRVPAWRSSQARRANTPRPSVRGGDRAPCPAIGRGAPVPVWRSACIPTASAIPCCSIGCAACSVGSGPRCGSASLP